MDWLIPVRDGEENPELKFALRSLVKNARLVEGLDRLVIVGYCPTWITPDLFIPGNDHRSGPVNVWENLRTACTSGLLDEQAIVSMDDVYALEPTDPTIIYYRAPLAAHIRALPQQTTWWAASLRLTHAYLRAHGIAQPLSYELHRPLLIDTEAMGRHLTDAWSGHGFPPQHRTIYANLQDLGGVQSRDCKVVGRRGDLHGPWGSTTDGAWRSGWSEQIEAMFPIPSIYEKGQP